MSTAERRQITVMFCDLVGSTPLSTRLDPEDLREIIGRYHVMVATTVDRFKGFVAKYMGDGVLAYFGYPHAHEYDAEQAVRAGLALIDAIGELQAPQRLQVRIGIATGLVVVGDLTGTGSAQEQAIVGETPNLAARLQAHAEPNAILIAESSRRQVGARFEVRDLGLQSLKGFAEPRRVWRVLRENRALGEFEALRSGTTPLVGRDDAMALLGRRWARAQSGRGQVVLISAEPGVGKSRLGEALAEQVATGTHARLRYFCSPHHQDTVLYPIIAHMERTAGFLHSDHPDTRLGKLQALLAAAAPPAADMALLAELHGLSSGDNPPPPDLTPQGKKDRTLEALLRQIEGLARQQPVLMTFDDVHWIDPTSQDLLNRIIERVANWPLLLLVLFRPEFQPPWNGQPHVTLLTLARLDRHTTAAMVDAIAGTAALSAEVMEEIAERADGVPLFVEELTKAVLEAGAHGPAALSAMPHPGLSVPASLHASLMARLDRLGPAAKGVAQTGAAIGREFSHSLLVSVTDLSESDLRQALDRLTQAGLVFVHGTPPQTSYVFKHALVQDAAYGTLLRSRRRRLHARIAATLEDQFPEIVLVQPALLAQHCSAAGRAEQAAAYWLKAGQQALAFSAMTEAVAQLRRGLGALRGLPDTPWHRQQELDLQIALASALTATAGWATADVHNTLARARMLAEQIDRPEYLAPLIVSQWTFHFVRAEHRLTLALGEQLETNGRARNDVATQLLGRLFHGTTNFYLGEFVAARAVLEQCMEFADPAYRSVKGLSFDLYAAVLAYLALTLACLGYVDQARSRMDEAVAEARRLGHSHTLAHVLIFASRLHWLTASPMLHLDEVQALTTEHGFRYYLGWAQAFRGRSLIAAGQATDGLALLGQGLAELRATGGVVCTPMLFTWLAEAHALLGQTEEQRDCLAEAARLIETTEERFLEAELLHRVPGDLLTATGDRHAAEQAYRQAIVTAERQSAKLLQLRASASLARLWRDQGRRAEARDLLGPICGWFTEGFGAADLQAAQALLDELA
ncbi:AAA family ATPase [Rhodopila globiformis]|uniref:AAA family ATPase n=1 Tax=Rhodopila globiformis TaxID=1071 RepID=UPI001304F612|nr:adenylate/guanylate cyclase domain-containing protein [Rhodopila globiformis]